MNFKPFKPLTIRRCEDPSEPPAKRQKTAIDEPVRNPQPQLRKPLQPLPNGSSSPKTGKPSSNSTIISYYSVLWRNVTTKKNKTWEGDGALVVDADSMTFYDTSGRVLGRLRRSRPLLPGSTLSISGKELEVDRCIGKDSFGLMIKSKNHKGKSSELLKPATVVSSQPAKPKPMSLKQQLHDAKAKAVASKQLDSIPSQQPRSTFNNVKEGVAQVGALTDAPVPKYDPKTPNALIFKRPAEAMPGQQIVDVLLDPKLAEKLRPHQREGVKFLYECVMGLRGYNGRGCILADDMGLGKTLQSIALIWTLIKQNPVHRAAPVVKKALIVCPVSVIKNWKKEFRRWLSHTNIGVLEFEDPKTTRLSMFDGKVYNVMIIGYERLRMVADELADSHDIDIVICDEGHRLKTVKNKSAKAIESLNTQRRIILSGTPIQNDLGEFYAMVNFVNDGCLGSSKSFAKDFEGPILKSRQTTASEQDIQRGEDASAELVSTTTPFILRRTASILSDFLPTKTEYVLFCKPTPQQATIYRTVVNSPMFRSALGNMETALQLITILKKLCNSPVLMKPESTSDNTTSTSLQTLNETLPQNLDRYYHNSNSSKIRLLDVLLHEIRKRTDEKVVLVSNYTSTLNLMARLLENCNLKYLRLDGSVPANRRQALIDQFNRSRPSQAFAFLLSAKAGGVGIDLTGASRLVLFDVDWNPATDDQAIARIHRQGQKRSTKIYRFLIKGGLEERIWQRQVVKRGLAESIMEGRDNGQGKAGKRGKASFSLEELKDLFRLDESEACRTHELTGCACDGTGLASASGVTTPAKEAEWDGTDEDPERLSSEELPDISTIVRASQLSTGYPEDQENVTSPVKKTSKRILEMQTGAEAHELMNYTHLDTSGVPKIQDEERLAEIEELVGDECLMHLLRQSEEDVAGAVAWVFKKMSGSEMEVVEAR